MIGHSLVGLGQEAEPPDRARFAEAAALFREALDLRRQLGDGHDIALAVFDLGYLALIQDDAARAAGFFAEALPLFEASGDRRGAAFSRWNLAWVAMNEGDNARAAELYGRALPVFRELGDREATAHVIEGVGWLAQRTGGAATAARLLGAADALRAADGIRLALPHRAGHDPTIAATRTALGEAAFAAAWAAGAALSVEAAIAEAIAAVKTVAATAPAEEAASAAIRLTPRERDVLGLIAEGMSDREIAAALSLSPRTVGWHVTHLLAKLGVPSRAAAVAFAHRHGLV
jgi:non-specific serine/threonine protein kinase